MRPTTTSGSSLRAKLVLVLAIAAIALPAAPARAQEALPNDDVADAIAFDSIPFSYEGSLDGATLEPAEPLCSDALGTVWFSFTAPEDADVVASTDGDILSVFEGSSFEDFREVSCAEGREQQTIAFPARQGRAYFFQVGSHSIETTGYSLLVGADVRGKIAGTIADEEGGLVAGACAFAWIPEFPEDDGEEIETRFGPAMADENGRYQIGNLAAGDYKVELRQCAFPQTHVEAWYDGASRWETASLVHVEEGETTTGIDAPLARGATISGTVTGEAGEPLEGVCVVGQTEYLSTGATTDAMGSYTLTGLPTGEARVAFEDQSECQTSEYVPEWYDDQPDFDSANPIQVTAGEDVAGIDAQLASAGSISGIITDEQGNELSGICVRVEAFDGAEFGFDGTGENGRYEVFGLQGGTYRLEFRDCSENVFLPEWYDDRASAEEAGPVTVVLGEETGGIDAVLSRGGSISGTVRGEDGEPLNNICVQLRRGQFAITDFSPTWNGEYRFGSLPPFDDYRVGFEECDGGTLIGEWYNDQPSASSADPIAVGAAEDVTGIDAVLSGGGSISGTVTTSDGEPLADACVAVFDAAQEQVGFGWTDELGEYRTDALAAGDYRVRFSDCAGPGYKTEWFDDKESFATADQVTVQGGTDTTGVDAQLASPGVVVTESEGSTHVSESGASDTYTIALEARPDSSVTVTTAPGSQLTTTPSSVTFTTSNWTTPKTITVRAVNDAIAEGDHVASVTHAATSSYPTFDGSPVSPVDVGITDNDSAGVLITESGGATSVVEGGASDTYSVKLTSQPAANVVVSMAPDAQVSVTPAALTFTPSNWGTARTVTVAAVDDLALEGAHSGAIAHSVSSSDITYQAVAARTVLASITDNERTETTVTYTGPAQGGVGSTTPVSGRLLRADGTPVSNRTLRFNLKAGDVTKQTVSAVTGADGRASASMTMNFPIGAYTLETRFEGDVSLLPSLDSDAFTVGRGSTTLTYMGPQTFPNGHSVSIVAWLRDQNGNGIAGKSVMLKLRRGTSSTWTTRTTSSSGYASYAFTQAAGSYTVEASFTGDSSYLGSSDSDQIEIVGIPTTLEVYGPTDHPYNSNHSWPFSARLLDASGNPIVGENVWFGFFVGDNARWGASGDTNAQGEVSVSLAPDLPPGDYRVETRFDGDPDYEAASDSVSVRIGKGSARLPDYQGLREGEHGQSLQLQTQVVDAISGDPLPGRNVRFTLGSVVRTGISGTDGVAAVYMPLGQEPGTYPLKIEVVEDTYYMPANDLTVEFQIRWPYEFRSAAGGGRVFLSPSTRRFAIGDGTRRSAMKDDPSMEVVTLPNGARLVAIRFSDAELTLAGTFNLETGAFSAVANWGGQPVVMAGAPASASD